jgi:sterol 3beta-glucosyltransferase
VKVCIISIRFFIMHLTMIAVGSRGDIQPFVALGVGLQKIGYRVRLAATPSFRNFIQNRGLEFTPLGADFKDFICKEAGLAWIERGDNPINLFLDYAELVRPVLRQELDSCFAACQDTDAILYGIGILACPHIAEALRVPIFSGILQPYKRTKAFPSCFLSSYRNWGGLYNWGSHFLIEQLLWQPFRSEINRWRQEVLGLKPWPFLGESHAQTPPTFAAYSPSVLTKPKDWPSHYHVSGYWFLEDNWNWQPPSDLLAFLAAGKAPIYIGFGSMPSRHPEKLTEIIVEALQRTNQRGIIMRGWAGLNPKNNSDRLFVTDPIPHNWLFPEVAAAVYHGGSGTTAAALRAGIPLVIIPFCGDQHFWGDRMNKLGVAPSPIPHKKLTVEALARAIAKVTEDENIKVRSRQLGEKIRAEDGVGNTVKIIDRYLQKQPFLVER